MEPYHHSVGNLYHNLDTKEANIKSLDLKGKNVEW